MGRKLILILAVILISIGAAPAQNITYTARNEPLSTVLAAIKAQTGYLFFYRAEDLAGARPITCRWERTPLHLALDTLFAGTDLSFKISHKTVVIIKRITGSQDRADAYTIHGVVVDSSGIPLDGASVSITGSPHGALTDARGVFSLKITANNDTLKVSYTGYANRLYTVKERTAIRIVLQRSIDPLDETVVIAYGSTTERLNPGSISTVKALDIGRQPVADVLQALETSVPGLEIAQVSGMGGSGYQTLQIRGVSSLTGGSLPLFLVDGVEVPGIDNISTGYNPFSGISPADIESVTVLKDADATAIYGSRGANGVILITTKKGKPGTTIVMADLSSGINTHAHAMKMLNTVQYLTMRREAFSNDGETPNAQNAPDLTGYGIGANINRFTNWQNALIGQTGNMQDARLSLSGGSSSTNFVLGAALHRETPTSPGHFDFTRPSVHLALASTSHDRRFSISLSSIYSYSSTDFNESDITPYVLNLPPNIPDQYNSDGSFHFYGASFYNPYAVLAEPQHTANKDLITSLTLSYRPFPGLELRSTFSYSDFYKTSIVVVPLYTLDQNIGYTSGNSQSTFFSASNWQIEPQAEYTRHLGKAKITALVGGVWQNMITNEHSIYATGFVSDAFLRDYSQAASTYLTRDYANYKYAGAFTRLNYTWQDEYVLNLTGRRDGSSRFGPGRQFGNFGAVGAAWIFSELPAFKKTIHWLDYAKFRTSYGITGNDQIGDYQYLDTYGPTLNIYSTNQLSPGLSYNDTPVLGPSRLFNPNYGWETTRKLDIGLDLRLRQGRILMSADWYRHRSSSLLLVNTLPPTTGFLGVFVNYPAIVGNQGWEFLLQSVNIKNVSFTWSTALTATFPRNQLVAFPGLSTSVYNNYVVVGQPLSTQKVYKYLGVDRQTGVYLFADKDGHPSFTPTPTVDQTALVNTDRRYYGGLSNSLHYHSLDLVIDLQYIRQNAYDVTALPAPPGVLGNFPVQIMSRWQKPGDVTNIEKFTQDPVSAAYQGAIYASSSQRAYTDGSFLRVKNVALSYELPKELKRRIHSKTAKIYLNAQNLLTFTRYIGNDPETGGIGELPPLRSVVGGIRCSF